MRPIQINLPDLLLFIAYMSFPVWCIARAIQWMQLKNFVALPKLLLIMLVSLVISYIITIVIWGGWPGKPMFSFICVPALVAEGFILLMTFMYKKSLVKKK
jgi:hypothetical protein